MFVHICRLALPMVGVASVAFGTTAQTSQPVREKSDDGGSLLSGPDVVETEQGRGAFGGRDGRLRARDRLTPQQWNRVLQTLELTEEQGTQFQELTRAFQVRARAFRTEHAEEVQELNELRRRGRDAGRGVDPKQAARARELQQLLRGAPEVMELQQQVWVLLDGEQQETMRAQVAEVRARLAEQRRQRLAQGTTDSDRSQDMEGMTDRPRASDEQAAPRRNPGGATLDDAGRKRLRFLRSRQIGGRPVGDEPTNEDREFHFDDDGGRDSNRGELD